MTPDPTKVRYEVEVVGHRPPFKWKLYRIIPNGNRMQVYGGDHEGEADSREIAISDATIAAERLHDEWLHASTKTIDVVFEGDAKAPEVMAAEELERQIADLSREVDQWGAGSPNVVVAPEQVSDVGPPKFHLPFPWPPKIQPWPPRDIED